MTWSFNLDDIIRYYKIHNELISHWKSIFGDSIIEVNYENLVNDTERETIKLTNFCGLKWSVRFLEFYKNKRNIISESCNDVRKPVYNSSINNWKPYENYMGEIISYATHNNID